MIFKKKFAYYVPCKDDTIDEGLRKYINKEPRNELRIMFVRVGPSTYYFGNHLIKVTISNSKVDDFTSVNNPAQINISFGNNSMDIDQFLK